MDGRLPLSTLLSQTLVAFTIEFLYSATRCRLCWQKCYWRSAVIEPESTGRQVKMLRLTPKGRRAQDAYHQFTPAIEQRWQTSFGKNTIASLRGALAPLAGEPRGQLSPLFRALEPYSDGWRAAVPRPESLPHYPMVLHRGGFPDGS
jgi:hypothetical protein